MTVGAALRRDHTCGLHRCRRWICRREPRARDHADTGSLRSVFRRAGPDPEHTAGAVAGSGAPRGDFGNEPRRIFRLVAVHHARTGLLSAAQRQQDVRAKAMDMPPHVARTAVCDPYDDAIRSKLWLSAAAAVKGVHELRTKKAPVSAKVLVARRPAPRAERRWRRRSPQKQSRMSRWETSSFTSPNTSAPRPPRPLPRHLSAIWMTRTQSVRASL